MFEMLMLLSLAAGGSSVQTAPAVLPGMPPAISAAAVPGAAPSISFSPGAATFPGAAGLTSPTGAISGVGVGISDDYMVFIYEMDEAGKITRRLADYTTYETFKSEQVDLKWVRVFTDFLMGNYSAHQADYGITPEQAELMVAMDPQILQTLKNLNLQDPSYQDYMNYRDELAKSLAEWTFFYEQLGYWNQYVQDQVLFDTLAPEEQITYNPATIEDYLPLIYEGMEMRGREASDTQKSLYDEMVMAIQDSYDNEETFRAWSQSREESMIWFAQKWARQFDGSEVRIGGVLYLVRNISERPENPEDDIVLDTLPRNAVLLDVPKEKLITPFDLIHEDGTVKRPIED